MANTDTRAQDTTTLLQKLTLGDLANSLASLFDAEGDAKNLRHQLSRPMRPDLRAQLTQDLQAVDANILNLRATPLVLLPHSTSDTPSPPPATP